VSQNVINSTVHAFDVVTKPVNYPTLLVLW